MLHQQVIKSLIGHIVSQVHREEKTVTGNRQQKTE